MPLRLKRRLVSDDVAGMENNRRGRPFKTGNFRDAKPLDQNSNGFSFTIVDDNFASKYSSSSSDFKTYMRKNKTKKLLLNRLRSLVWLDSFFSWSYIGSSEMTSSARLRLWWIHRNLCPEGELWYSTFLIAKFIRYRIAPLWASLVGI